MYLHIVGLITIYVLPRFIRGERSPQQQSKAVTVPLSANGIQPPVTLPANGIPANGYPKTKSIVQSNTNSMPKKSVQFVDDVLPKCDINVNYDNVNSKLRTTSVANGVNDSVSNASSSVSAAGATSVTRNSNDGNLNDYRRHAADDDQHLSMKIRERIDSETRYIEEFIDKTVTGIVEHGLSIKDDLMRVNQDEMYSTFEYGNGVAGSSDDGMRKRNLPDLTNGNDIEKFLRNEKVLPAVLSNGHAD